MPELYNHFVKGGWVKSLNVPWSKERGLYRCSCFNDYFGNELLIFDVYKSYSIKYTQRNSRSQSGSGGKAVEIKKDDKSFQYTINSFWESIENKSQL